MRSSYLDYAMSVIVGRALPDVRDGLKPVHRRVLFSMNENGLQPNRPYAKSARIVGDVMGKYHPHGDSAIYDALVRLAQDFSMRNMLVDGQGNFGSIDEDPAAAMRYCIAGPTRIGLPLGSVPIEELAEDLEPDSERDARYTVLDRLARPVRASKVFNSGDHPTLRLRTREGYEITGTHNHPVLCLVDVVGVPMLMWKRLDEIKPGDRTVISRTPRPSGGELAADERCARRSCSAPSSPRAGWRRGAPASTTPISEFFERRRLRPTTSTSAATRYVSERVIKLRAASVTSSTSTDLERADRTASLGELLGQRAAGKRVPELVWRSTPAFKRAFLQALFTGDGSSSLLPRKTIQISYSSYSRRLARGVQDLLLEFGVISRLCGPSERGEYKVVITNRRDARLFSRRVGFLGTKQRKLRRELRAVPATSRALSQRPRAVRRRLRPRRRRRALHGARLAAPPQRRPDRALGARRRRRSARGSPTTRCGRWSSRWSPATITTPRSPRSSRPASRRSTPCASTRQTTRFSPTASSATTPRRGWRRSRARCCATSTPTRSTSSPTTTARTTSRSSCRRASRTCSSTARAASRSAWRRTSRRTTCARRSPPRSPTSTTRTSTPSA